MVTNFYFQNKIYNKNALKELIYNIFLNFGYKKSQKLADKIKNLGFLFGTNSGLSLNIEDLKILPQKNFEIQLSKKNLDVIDKQYKDGKLTYVERIQKIINTWNHTSENLKEQLLEYFEKFDPFNSIYIMAFSGARGNISQVRQLIAMRGLMSTPSGDLLDVPIIHNFKEGLSITDYLMSSYGARKGVVDTALRTADSGYLTRRLVEVAHDFIIRESDCFTKNSTRIFINNKNFKKFIGRCVAENIYDKNNKLIFKKNEILNNENLLTLKDAEIKEIYVYSPLLCESNRSICQKCYGWDLSKCKKVSLGTNIGIIAAQSIGEPGTQLTMRTFHTGGVFLTDSNNQIKSQHTGLLKYHNNLNLISKQLNDGKFVKILPQTLEFSVVNFKNKTINFTLPANSYIYYKHNQFITKNSIIAELINPLTQKKKLTKTLITNDSGELYFNSKNNILTLLKGDIYNIQKKLFIDNSVANFDKNNKLISICKTFYNNESKGFLNYIFSKKNLSYLKIANSSVLKLNTPLFLNRKNINTNFFIINNSPLSYEKVFIKNIIKNSNVKWESYTLKYYLPFNSEFAYVKNKFYNFTSNLEKEVILKNSIALILPYTVFRQKISQKTNIHIKKIKKNKKTKIYFIPNTIFSIDELKFLKNQFFSSKKFNKTNLNNVFIKYKGEILFGKIKINTLSICEINLTKSYLICTVTKLFAYNISKNTYLNKNINSDIKLNSKSILNIDLLNHTNRRLEYLKKKQFLIINKKELIKDKSIKLNFEKVAYYNTKTFLSVLTIKSTKIQKLAKTLKLTKNEKIDINTLIKTWSYLNTKTIKQIKTDIKDLKPILKKINFNQNKILCLSQKFCKRYYNEFPMKKSNLMIPTSYTLHKKNIFNYVINETLFYKTEKSTNLLKKDGFIEENNILGTLTYEKLITGDIIQGLPKIEEILEARQPNNSCVISGINGLIINILNTKNNEVNSYIVKVMTNDGKLKEILINSSVPLTIKKNDYVFVGKSLNEGNLNCHNLINVYFNYFKNFLNQLNATKRTFNYIQILLIKKIQQIFENQNITISDKHIEIIVKKITSKVKLENTKESLYIIDSIINLIDVEYINKVLVSNKKAEITYKPILLGITKISLINQGFLSAASFQETQRILKIAALNNKIDWLTEIKSNILLGKTKVFGAARA